MSERTVHEGPGRCWTTADGHQISSGGLVIRSQLIMNIHARQSQPSVVCRRLTIRHAQPAKKERGRAFRDTVDARLGDGAPYSRMRHRLACCPVVVHKDKFDNRTIPVTRPEGMRYAVLYIGDTCARDSNGPPLQNSRKEVGTAVSRRQPVRHVVAERHPEPKRPVAVGCSIWLGDFVSSGGEKIDTSGARFPNCGNPPCGQDTQSRN